ncbi:hypothetical protein PMAYCL1PPCAC_29255 [Pristionchus mayeri]|uniref:Protein quiver n=1 Tax=Pristionchus mayeri TaxID=1317129 RepID=A0AAN5DAH2_9BILA|nr:hypothetical protein PMAYCL1PPCAC_29255 [Pristionchus mayeri]
MLHFLLPSFIFVLRNSLVEGIGCYKCSSPDSHLEAPLLLQLKSQTDIFFYSDNFSPSCNHRLNAHDAAFINVELCDEISRCVTLSPSFNLPSNESVVHRGCFASLLRHKFRDRKFVQQEGCFLLRSTPLYDVDRPVDYVLCVCSENYCNTIVPPIGEDLFTQASLPLRRLHSEKKMSLLHLDPSTGLLQLDFPLSNLSISPSLPLIYILRIFMFIFM